MRRTPSTTLWPRLFERLSCPLSPRGISIFVLVAISAVVLLSSSKAVRSMGLRSGGCLAAVTNAKSKKI